MMALSLTGLQSFLAEYAIWRLINIISNPSHYTHKYLSISIKNQQWQIISKQPISSSSIILYQMKKQQLSLRSKIQFEQNDLDPLEINELIVQQKIFLPLIIPENQQAKVYPLIFKILRDNNLDKIIIYVLSEMDLYFLYKFQVSYEAMIDLNNQYKLSLKKLSDFVEFMKGSLDDIENHQKQGTVEITSQNQIEFVLTRVVAGKNHIVMQLYGRQQSQEMIKAQVAYRYGALRERIHRKQERIQYLREVVKQKYPHLLKNFKQI